MSLKPDPKQYIQMDNPKSGCGLGCWAIGCTGIIALFVMLCGGGFYGIFYSRLPLMLIEAAIEEGGEIEIEGLDGNLTSGFTADELRFKSAGDKWSKLTDLKFKYSGGSSIFGTNRIIIEEVSVNGGILYADWDPETNEFDFGTDFASELGEVGDEFDDEFREEFGRSDGIREFRIDLVHIANLRIVNPTTEMEITLDEIRFEQFHWLDNELINLGELFVKSSQMDLETVPSVEFEESKNARRFEGMLRSQIDHRLKKDVPFAVDFSVDDHMKASMHTFLFNEQLHYIKTPDDHRLVYDNFSSTEFLEQGGGRIPPSNLQMVLTFGNEKTDGIVDVDEDGSFDLGETHFTDLHVENPDQGGDTRIVAAGNVKGEKVEARIQIESALSPFFKIWLTSKNEAYDDPNELWAQTVFGDDYSKLSDEQQSGIGNSQIPLIPKRPKKPEQPDAESVEDAPSNGDSQNSEEKSDPANDRSEADDDSA